jgi:ABC-type spermidine/putrescine transport system permease subunit II
MGLVLTLIYIPILVLVVNSFNASSGVVLPSSGMKSSGTTMA